MLKLADACSILSSTQQQLFDARKTLDDAGHARVLVNAEVNSLRKERERPQNVKESIDAFKRGATAKLYEKKMAELEEAVRSAKIMAERDEEDRICSDDGVCFK